MALIVKKFGGSSVATPEKIFNIVDRVLREKQADDKIFLLYLLWVIQLMTWWP